MKTKKLISLLCAAALTVSSFAGLTITAGAAAGDKIADVVTLQNFNSLTTGVILDGDDAAEKTSTDVPYFKLVTTNRKDVGHYTDKEGTEIVTGNVYSILEREDDATNKYLRLGFPMFGDFTKNGRYGHADFVDADGAAVTYAADATKDYVIEFDAKFTSGMAKGVVSAEGSYNAVLRIGTFDKDGKKDNAVVIDKAALSIGDDWVHVKSVTSLKGTKVYLDNADVYVANSTATTAVNAFGLYSTDGQTTISPPKDVFNAGLDSEILDADKHTFSPTVDIDNLTIYTAEPEKEADITINYKDGEGNALKTATTVTGVVGKQFTVPAAYLVNIDNEGDSYYKYASGADTFTVADGENTVNLVFDTVAKPTVTFNATTGDSKKFIAKIGEAKAMPGTKTTAEIYAHEYIQDADGNWYQKDDGKKGGGKNHDAYDMSAVAGETDTVETVNYKPANNVVSFMEAEDNENAVQAEDGLAGGTYGTTYPVLNASGGAWAQSTQGGTYPNGFYTEAVTEAGTYEVTIRTRDFKRPSAVAKVAQDETMTKIGETPADGGISFTTIKVDLEAGEKIWVGKNGEIGTDDPSYSNTKAINDVDYIVIKDAAKKAEEDPVVTFSYENKTVSLTTDKDRTVNAVVIHAQYGSGMLTNLKSYPVTIASGTTPTEVAIEEAVYTGDKFMVWDSLQGMVPYMEPYTVVSGDSKPKFAVTVAEGITNGTVTADKAEAEQGDTVTLTVTPAEQFAVDTITVTDADGTAVKVTNNAFIMPAKAVTVTATFKASAYTIKGTVDANVAGVTLTKGDTKLTGTIEGGGTTVTFTNVTAGTYTVSARYKAGFEEDAITPAEIEVTADNDTAFTITSKASAKPAITGTVEITGTADIGETLTAAITGLNDGETAVYEWESADAADGTFTAIADAAAQTYVVPEAMAGKYIKVVVTTEGTSGHIDAEAVAIPAYYTITVTTPENGTVAVKSDETEVTKAKADTALTITATPADGYEIGTITVKDASDNAVNLAVNGRDFTMPTSNVTVTVTFKAVDNAVYLIGAKNTPVNFAEDNKGTWTAGGSTLTATVNSTDEKPYVQLVNTNGGGSCYYYATFAETKGVMDLQFEVNPTSGSLALDLNRDGWNTWTNHTSIAVIKSDALNYGTEKIADLTAGEWTAVKISMDLDLGTITFTVGDGAPVTKPMTDLNGKAYQSNDGGVKPVSATSIRFIHNNKAAADINFTNFLMTSSPRETALPTKTLTVAKNNEGGKAYIGTDGTTTSTVTQSENVTATAEGTEKVRFDGWKGADGAVLATTAAITRRMFDDETITASFTQLYSIELTYALNGAATAGVEVTMGETKKTTDENGKVTFIVEPGEYTATTAAGDYKATTKTVTVSSADVTDSVALESNAQTLAAIEIDSSAMNTGVLTTTAASKVIGRLLTKQYADAAKTEPMVTPAAVTWTADEGIAVAADGTVTITSAVAAGNHTITAAAGALTETYTLTVNETGTETVTVATDDFSGTANIFGAANNGVQTNGTLNTAQVITDTGNGWANHYMLYVVGATATATGLNIAPTGNDTATISYREYNGYLSGNKTNTVSFINSDGKEILSYVYDTTACNVTDVKIGGTTVPAVGADAFAAFHAQCGYTTSGDANGWSAGAGGKPYQYKTTEDYNPVVKVEITGNTVKLTYKSSGAKKPTTMTDYVFTAALGNSVKANVDTMKIVSTVNNAGRGSGISDLRTTITKAE